MNMIRKIGNRFSDKIMLKRKERAPPHTPISPKSLRV